MGSMRLLKYYYGDRNLSFTSTSDRIVDLNTPSFERLYAYTILLIILIFRHKWVTCETFPMISCKQRMRLYCKHTRIQMTLHARHYHIQKRIVRKNYHVNSMYRVSDFFTSDFTTCGYKWYVIKPNLKKN